MFTPQATAFLFPGQGSQAVGMGASLAAAYPQAEAIFAQADRILGFSLSRLMWDGPEEELNDTANTQPALLVHSVAALRVLQTLYPDFKPAYVAGHSLGEFSALVAAGALDFESALRLVRRRGELMRQAGEHSPGGMAALLGLDLETVESVCTQASQGEDAVQIANDNCPGQVVISGNTAALERAVQAAEQAGARKVVRLAVSIAAHSHLMARAQDEFNQAVAEAQLQQPHTPIIGNVSAHPLTTVDEIRADLQAQLTHRVRWTESMQFLRSQGIDTFLEIGSGDVLCGLIKRIDRKTTRLSLGEAADFEKLQANAV